ncbi:MAG TPA: hypothetical protein VF834_06165 [Streptosporangiaceae bacterium]
MTPDLARWQSAPTSISHFFVVPVTLGLAFRTALLRAAWTYHVFGRRLSARDFHSKQSTH